MKSYWPLSLLLFIAVGACNLEQEVDITLPDYNEQAVLEAYLEPGERYRLLLTRSAGYFDALPSLDSFIQELLLQDAEAQITHDGMVYKLENEIAFDFETQKIYNYISSSGETVPLESDLPFELLITLPDGSTIEAVARLLPKVPIDSVVIQFPDNERDTLSRVLTYFTDDAGDLNFYRRTLHLNSFLDSVPQQDFVTDDRFLDRETVVFGTGFDYAVGDTVINTLYHISEEYATFLQSVAGAAAANGNPFGQPSPIISSLGGTAEAIGIFTGLVFDQRVDVIER